MSSQNRFPHQNDNSFDASEWIQRGDRLLKEKKISEAVEVYSEAIKMRPNSALHHSKLGNALLRLKQFDRAERCFQQAVTLSPQSHLGLYGLAQVAAGRERWEEAIARYRQVIELKPGFLAAVYQDLGVALKKLQRWDDASEVFRLLMQINPESWQVYCQLGETLEELEQWDEAGKIYSNLLQKKPSLRVIQERLQYITSRNRHTNLSQDTTEVEITSLNEWNRRLKLIKGVSIFTCCMNRNANLRESIQSWLACEGIDEIVIVDWNSKEPVKSTLSDIKDPRIVIIRVVKQEKWILSHAFNLAARLTTRDKILKLDADIKVQSDFLKRNVLEKTTFLTGNWRLVPDDQAYINGCIYLYRAAFFDVNGFSEWITTYGWDDTDLYHRLEEKGYKRADLDIQSLNHLLHSEEDRLLYQMENNEKYGYNQLRRLTKFNNRKNRFISFVMPVWNRNRSMLDFRIIGKFNRDLTCEQIHESRCKVPSEIIADAEFYTARELLSWRLGPDILSLNRQQINYLITNREFESISKHDISVARCINIPKTVSSFHLILRRGLLTSTEFIYCLYLLLLQAIYTNRTLCLVDNDVDGDILEFINHLSNSSLLIISENYLPQNNSVSVRTPEHFLNLIETLNSEDVISENLIIECQDNAVSQLTSQIILSEEERVPLLGFGKKHKSINLLAFRDLQYQQSLYDRLLDCASNASNLQDCLEALRTAIRFAQFQTADECYQSILKAMRDSRNYGKEERRFKDLLQKELTKYDQPVVTIITSIFNGDEYIEDFLADITRQTMFGRCELILINPNSPGNEETVVVEYMEKFKNIKYKRLDYDPGLYDCWNMAIMMGRGEYVTNANLDDRRAPQHLEVLVSALDKRPDVDVTSSALYVTRKKNERWENSSAYDVWFLGFPELYDIRSLFVERNGAIKSQNIAHCMPVWRRKIHDQLGFFDEHTYGSSCDWEFWLRCASQGLTFTLIGQPLGLYLENPESHNRRFSNTELLEQKIVERYCIPSQQGSRILPHTYSPALADILEGSNRDSRQREFSSSST